MERLLCGDAYECKLIFTIQLDWLDAIWQAFNVDCVPPPARQQLLRGSLKVEKCFLSLRTRLAPSESKSGERPKCPVLSSSSASWQITTASFTLAPIHPYLQAGRLPQWRYLNSNPPC
eukprot:1160053-Pelagomonas_calceolata.AAC.9